MYLLGTFILLNIIGFTFGIECPKEGQHWYPHPTRCTKFIECFNGIQAEQDCFADLIFNPDTGHCDFRENYACEDVEDVEEVPKEGPVGNCPAVNGQYVDFLTDATRCNVYYMCNWGTAIQMTCPAGLHFNPRINVCDWPSAARCTLPQ